MHVSLLLAASLIPCTALGSPSLESRQSSTTVTVNVNQKFQEIDGFGFSEAFQRANGIVNLPEPKRTQVVDLLFNTTTGAGFTILRNGIGSSTSSQNDWMNTFLPTSPGSPSGTPNYQWDGKDSGQLWVSQQAVKYGVKTFYGDAWSAPGFMKNNNRDSNGGCLCGTPGCSCPSGDWRQAYANYLVKYIELYAEAGIPVTHIGFVNEPDFTASYASMLVNPAQAVDFFKILRPTLNKAGHEDVSIACCETTGFQPQVPYTQQLNSVASPIDVITYHTYSSGISGPQPTKLKAWQTEASDLSGRWSTAWYQSGGAGDGYTWANNIWTGLVTGNLSAYLFWEGTQDRATNNNNNEKLILVEATTYEVSKRLWAFAQYSRTVRPKAIRVGTSGGQGLRVTAFVNEDTSIAVNMINTGNGAVNVAIGGVKASNATAWVTDNQRDMVTTAVTVGADGGLTGISIPGHGMVSVVARTASPA